MDSSELKFNLRARLRGVGEGEPEEPECWDNSPSAESGLGGRFRNFMLVGMGVKTNEKCGVFIGLKGCLDIGKHNAMPEKCVLGGQVGLEGKNVRNKVFVRKVHHSCNKPSCPECFKYGWAIREARKIEARVLEAESRCSGKVEHIIVSPSFKDLSVLSFDDLRLKVQKMLAAREVVGGSLIFHGFRFRDSSRHWYWSPHFHVLGFVLHGYGRCRGCKRSCAGCDGFEGRTRKEFEKDGCIVKIAVDREGNSLERKSVYATALYELRHATIRSDVVRPHAVTWFGTCSYRKLKVVIPKQKSTCAICGQELRWVTYLGRRCICKVQTVFGYVHSYVDDYYDSEKDAVYVYSPSVSYGYFDRGYGGE